MLLRLFALTVLLALPLAGCGTSAKDKYRQHFRKVADSFHSSVQKAGGEVQSGSTLQQRVPALRSFEGSVNKLASDLAALHPPKSLERANADAVRQLHTLSSDLSDYERAASANDRARAARIVPKLQADQTLLQKTLDELDRQVSG